MSKFSRMKAQCSVVQQIIVCTLCIMVAASSFSDAISHFDFSSEHSHSGTHQQKNSHELKAGLATPDTDLFAHSYDESSDKDHVPLNDHCQAAGEAHLCLTAIMAGKTGVTGQPFGKNFIQLEADGALSLVSFGLYRPPIFLL